jgi:hypothetical protein
LLQLSLQLVPIKFHNTSKAAKYFLERRREIDFEDLRAACFKVKPL